jgi:hypothetical protein
MGAEAVWSELESLNTFMLAQPLSIPASTTSETYLEKFIIFRRSPKNRSGTWARIQARLWFFAARRQVSSFDQFPAIGGSTITGCVNDDMLGRMGLCGLICHLKWARCRAAENRAGGFGLGLAGQGKSGQNQSSSDTHGNFLASRMGPTPFRLVNPLCH